LQPNKTRFPNQKNLIQFLEINSHQFDKQKKSPQTAFQILPKDNVMINKKLLSLNFEKIKI